MKLLSLLFGALILASCGGGKEPVASPLAQKVKATAPLPVKKATTVAGANAVVIQMYQALYGMAPSNARFLDYATQANNDASLFAKNLTDRFAATSHADLAKLVLDNLGIMATTVPAINAKGEGEYGLLLDAVKQLFAVYPTMRGQVILNMTNLLAGLETDVTYGNAAAAYNSQISANYSYSSQLTSLVQTAVAITTASYFSNSYTLPDISGLVAGLCADPVNGAMGPTIGIVDLNGDGIKDIVTSYWCSYRPSGGSYNGPTPNTLIVFLSRPDGTYFLGNKTLFGADRVDIGGFGRMMSVADFNNDGRPDVGIAISKEDGRGQDATGTAWNAPQVMLLSKSDGTYVVQHFQPTQASGTAQAVDNAMGGVDFVYPTTLLAPATAFRWVNDSWMQIPSYPAVNVGMNFFPRPLANLGSQALITISTNPDDGVASLELKTLVNGSWIINSRYAYPFQMVDVINWNTAPIQTQRSIVQGIDMLYSTFEDSCFLKLYPTSVTPILLGRMTGFPISKTWDGVSVIQLGAINSISMLVPFDMTGNVLSPMTASVFDVPLVDQFFFRYKCEDINGDGYQDVVINTNGSNPSGKVGIPVFYINNKNGKLIRTSIDGLPRPPQNSSGWADSFSEYEDMNGDGIKDLIYYTSSQFPYLLKYPIKIIYGTKSIGK